MGQKNNGLRRESGADFAAVMGRSFIRRKELDWEKEASQRDMHWGPRHRSPRAAASPSTCRFSSPRKRKGAHEEGKALTRSQERMNRGTSIIDRQKKRELFLLQRGKAQGEGEAEW